MAKQEVEKTLDFDKIAVIARKNWKVMKADKTRLIALSVFPLIMILIFGYTSGVTPKQLPAGIADQDQSAFSNEVAAQLQTLNVLSIKYNVGTESEGKKLMDQGKLKVLIIIPAGFGEAARTGKVATLKVMVDESDPSVAQIAKGTVSAFVQGLSSGVSVKRIQLLQLQAKAASAKLAATQALLASSGAGGAAVDAYALASRSLNNAQTKLKQGTNTIKQTTENIGRSLTIPESPDTLRSAKTDSASFAGTGSANAQQLALLTQIAFYNSFGTLNQYVLQQVLAAQSAASQLSAANAAQEAVAAQASDEAGSANKFLAEFTSADASAVADPIRLDEEPAYGQNRQGIDFLLPSILALIIFQGATMGMGRSIAGEREKGSLTRVFLTPTSNATIIVGTQLFYLIFEVFRSTLIVILAVLLFGIHVSGSALDTLFIIVLFATGSVGVGLVISAMAKTEEQFTPMAMLISLPSMFLSGAFFPIQTMPAALQGIAYVLPITYAASALRGVMIKGFSLTQVIPDLAFLSIFAVAMIILSLIVFKRESL